MDEHHARLLTLLSLARLKVLTNYLKTLTFGYDRR
jgi:hypothetical protein